MIRLSTLLIALCAVVIAASLGMLANLTLGMTLAEACMVGLTALVLLTGIAVYDAIAGVRRERREFATQTAAQVNDLARGIGDLARQMTDQMTRVAVLEGGRGGLGSVADEIAAAIKPIQAEIVELGSLVQQLAEASVAHDAALRDPFSAHRALTLQAALPAGAPAEGVGAPTMTADVWSSEAELPAIAAADDEAQDMAQNMADEGEAQPDIEPQQPPREESYTEIVVGGPFHGLRREEAVARVREAIDEHRIDLFLQPVVTLPQRKVRFYEAVMRLRMPDGSLLTAADFIDFAESGGLMPRIDLSMILRCARVARRLMSKNRDIGLFCNLSTSTLRDSKVFAELMEFLQANRALAHALMFEIQHAALSATDERENNRIGALMAEGFRLSVDHIADLAFDIHPLAAKGCRFIKIPAELLLAKDGAAGDIVPTDLPGLLRRYGIELIAEKIEQESAVADLLDFDIKFAQGHLFSPPRPVRPEVMQAEPIVVPTAPPVAVAKSEPPPRLKPAPERPAAMADRISALTQMARRVARSAS